MSNIRYPSMHCSPLIQESANEGQHHQLRDSRQNPLFDTIAWQKLLSISPSVFAWPRHNAMPASNGDPLQSELSTPAASGVETILPICEDLAARVQNFLDAEAPTPLLKNVQRQTSTALKVIEECLQRYRLEEISLSYNGGKDCLVLLILLLVAISKHNKLPAKLQTVYIISPHPFDEVTSFVASSVATYKLDLARYALPMKEGFQRYLDERKGVKAILVGTRRTDPHGEHLTHFDMTDGGWPRFMRVHPVIDWHYTEIWAVSSLRL
ncbi:FAD synthetase [Phlyctema vagabunda]|uniref:FAD synthase n=1 Tax=Phlyctema vagabunda TaxID=108571 RepID=A0ABR4PV27_9HELO